jgi:hypothetical protein
MAGIRNFNLSARHCRQRLVATFYDFRRYKNRGSQSDRIQTPLALRTLNTYGARILAWTKHG